MRAFFIDVSGSVGEADAAKGLAAARARMSPDDVVIAFDLDAWIVPCDAPSIPLHKSAGPTRPESAVDLCRRLGADPAVLFTDGYMAREPMELFGEVVLFDDIP